MLDESMQRWSEKDNCHEIGDSDSKNLTELTPEKLAKLQQRLKKVQGWGGIYVKIDFSPNINAIIKDNIENTSQSTTSKRCRAMV